MYFNRKEVESAIADLEANKKLPLEQARQNGWKVEVETRYGLTTWVKDFENFSLSEDRGGQRGLSKDGHLCCNFLQISSLEEEGWVESIPQLAIARGK